MQSILSSLGEQLRTARACSNLSQAELAQRVGRSSVRISELERDLRHSRWGRDRLTLLVEICDALGVEPMLVPRARAAEFREYLEKVDKVVRPQGEPTSAFDELFVDLGDDKDED